MTEHQREWQNEAYGYEERPDEPEYCGGCGDCPYCHDDSVPAQEMDTAINYGDRDWEFNNPEDLPF